MTSSSRPSSSRTLSQTLVERRADARCRGVDDERRAGEEQLLAVGSRLEAKLGREVGGAQHEARHPGRARRLVREAQPGGRLDDRDHGRPVRAERVDGVGRRLRQHDRVEGQVRDRRERRPSKCARVGAVDRARRAGGRRRPRPRRRQVSSRAASFSPGATASSRSAMTASASDSSARVSLRSSVPGAKRTERRFRAGRASTPSVYMSDIRQAVNRVRPSEPRLPLDRVSEVRHKHSLPP